jgi:hypothetical protein
MAGTSPAMTEWWPPENLPGYRGAFERAVPSLDIVERRSADVSSRHSGRRLKSRSFSAPPYQKCHADFLTFRLTH